MVFTPQQQNSGEAIAGSFQPVAIFSVPTVKECQAELGEELFAALMDQQIFVLVHPGNYFSEKDYEALRSYGLEGHFSSRRPLLRSRISRPAHRLSRRY